MGFKVGQGDQAHSQRYRKKDQESFWKEVKVKTILVHASLFLLELWWNVCLLDWILWGSGTYRVHATGAVQSGRECGDSVDLAGYWSEWRYSGLFLRPFFPPQTSGWLCSRCMSLHAHAHGCTYHQWLIIRCYIQHIIYYINILYNIIHKLLLLLLLLLIYYYYVFYLFICSFIYLFIVIIYYYCYYIYIYLFMQSVYLHVRTYIISGSFVY